MHAVRPLETTLMSGMAPKRASCRWKTVAVLETTPGTMRTLAFGRPTPGARTRSARVSDVAGRPVSANVSGSSSELVLKTKAP
jgi:hypothetical protein